MSNLALRLLESVAMVGVVELADRWPMDVKKRMNADYHGKGGQLCYRLPRLCVSTLYQYRNRQQKNYRLRNRCMALCSFV